MKWFWGADEGAEPCTFIITARSRCCCFIGMDGAEACVDVRWWLSLAGEWPTPLLDCAPDESTMDAGEVSVKSSMNILLGSAVWSEL